jgi:hypothetical protein
MKLVNEEVAHFVSGETVTSMLSHLVQQTYHWDIPYLYFFQCDDILSMYLVMWITCWRVMLKCLCNKYIQKQYKWEVQQTCKNICRSWWVKNKVTLIYMHIHTHYS